MVAVVSTSGTKERIVLFQAREAGADEALGAVSRETGRSFCREYAVNDG